MATGDEDVTRQFNDIMKEQTPSYLDMGEKERKEDLLLNSPKAVSPEHVEKKNKECSIDPQIPFSVDVKRQPYIVQEERKRSTLDVRANLSKISRESRQVNRYTRIIDESELPSDLSQNDVLLSTFRVFASLRGNTRFMEMLDIYRTPYITTPKLLNKAFYCNQIIQSVREASPPGRFLVRDIESGKWKEMNDAAVRKKVGEMMRKKEYSKRTANLILSPSMQQVK